MRFNPAFYYDPASSRSQTFVITRTFDPAGPLAKLTATLATVVTINKLLIDFFSKISQNQTRKLQETQAKSQWLLKKLAQKIKKEDIGIIYNNLDILCRDFELATQESWSTYLSFCLAILNDEYEKIEKSVLSMHKDQFFEIIKKLGEVHTYMESKEGREVTMRFSDQGLSLYEKWRTIFK